MTYNTKTEFLTGLREALERNNITDMRDILTDFRQHFEDGAASGESEAEVCAKLGDVDDIVRQYIADMEQERVNTESTGFGGNTYEQPQQNTGYSQQNYQQPQYQQAPQYQQPPQQSGADGGKIAGVIILDILVYSWALPALLGLIVGLYSVTVTFAGTGISLLVGGLISLGIDLGGFIMTGLPGLAVASLGIMFVGFAGMLVIASIGATKGFINICIAIINQHSRAFSGRKVLDKIGKKKEAAV